MVKENDWVFLLQYEFKRTFNTRAYTDGNKVEIRDYGKVTVGRAGIKKTDFFNYMQEKHPELVFIDEENKMYLKVYEYNGILLKEDFAAYTVKFTKLMDEFKKQYR